MHAPAQRAGKFFFRGTGLPTVMRKNQPLVPRSNFGRKACARTAPWFRGQTLPVPGHGGGGGYKRAIDLFCACGHSRADQVMRSQVFFVSRRQGPPKLAIDWEGI